MGANFSASISAPLSQSYSSGGSAQQAANGSQSSGYSLNYPVVANANAAAQAELAFERQKELNQMTMDFNREEAAKQRSWEEQMANTIYTRSVKNMKEAGINPVLAAGMGLSGAGVSSGATASFGGSSAPMATSFMGSESANNAHSWGESQGSSWSQSEGGIITALNGLAGLFSEMAGAASSSTTVNVMMDGLADLFDTNPKTVKETVTEAAKGIVGGLVPGLGNLFNPFKSIHEKAKEKAKEKAAQQG